MQISYLSARPDVFFETLEHVRGLMPWIDDVVVVVPERLKSVFEQRDPDNALTVLTDEELLPDIALDSLDHARRNFALRAAMVRHDAIATEFIMADDDYRPLDTIPVSIFRDDSGRHRRYSFYQLRTWRGADTPFDDSQLHSLLVLQQLGLDNPLAFASHMPQMIRRDLYREVVDRVAKAAEKYPLCEWSIYANFGAHISPENFGEPEPFRTLAWPQYPSEWPRQVVPTQYVFENFHPELYEPNGLFASLPTSATSAEITREHALEKAVRWHLLERSVNRLEFPDDIDNPWIQNSPVRRAAFGAARAAKKLIDYTHLDDLSALSELTERVRRVESRLDPQN